MFKGNLKVKLRNVSINSRGSNLQTQNSDKGNLNDGCQNQESKRDESENPTRNH